MTIKKDLVITDDVSTCFTVQQVSELLNYFVSEIKKLIENLSIADDELTCFTVQQTAKLLNHSVSEIRKLIKNGKLHAIHTTKTSIRIRKIELLEYIKQKEEEEQW